MLEIDDVNMQKRDIYGAWVVHTLQFTLYTTYTSWADDSFDVIAVTDIWSQEDLCDCNNAKNAIKISIQNTHKNIFFMVCKLHMRCNQLYL